MDQIKKIENNDKPYEDTVLGIVLKYTILKNKKLLKL